MCDDFHSTRKTHSIVPASERLRNFLLCPHAKTFSHQTPNRITTRQRSHRGFKRFLAKRLPPRTGVIKMHEKVGPITQLTTVNCLDKKTAPLTSKSRTLAAWHPLHKR